MLQTRPLPFDGEPMECPRHGRECELEGEPPLLSTYTEEDIRERERQRRALEAKEAHWRKD